MALIQVTYYDKGMGRTVHGWTYVQNVNQNTVSQKASSLSKTFGTNVSVSGSNGNDNFNASANNGTVNSSGFSPVHNSNSSSNQNPSTQNSSSTHKPMEMVNTVTGQRIKLPSVGKPPKNAPGLNFSGTSTAPRQQSLGSSIGFINFNNPNANTSNEALATDKKGVEYVVKLNKNNQITSVWNNNEWQSSAAPVSASSTSNTLNSSKNSPITKSQQNSAQSNLNSAVMNAIATQSVLNNTIAGLNPVSSYLMENSAQKQLNNAINKANKQKTGVLPQEAKFVNSLNLSLANSINSSINNMNKTNKTNKQKISVLSQNPSFINSLKSSFAGGGVSSVNNFNSSQTSSTKNSKQNSAQSNLNSAVTNAMATQFGLKYSLAGLNPISTYLMGAPALKQLSNAINKANKQKTKMPPREAQLINSLDLSLFKKVNSSISKINQINKQIRAKQEAQQKWIHQHPILSSLTQAESHVKNTLLNLNAWKSAFSGFGQNMKKMATTPPAKLPAGLPSQVYKMFKYTLPLNFEINQDIAIGKGIVQGAKDIANSVKGIANTFESNYGFQVKQDNDKIGAAIRSAVNTAAEVGIGSVDYFATLPYNVVKNPYRVVGQFVVGGAISKGLHIMVKNLGLTTNDVLTNAADKLSESDLTLKGFPRLTENWNSAITHTDTLGRTIVDNLRMVKGKIEIVNEPRAYSLAPKSARLSKIDVVAQDKSVIRPFANIYSKTGKNLNAYRGAVRTALSDVRITHVVKPTNIMDYTLSDASTFLKGTLEKTKDAIRGSEYGQVKVNTILGPKIVNVARRFVSKTKNDEVHTLSKLTLSLGKKSKTVQNFVVAPKEESTLIFQGSTPTINRQPSPSSAVQIKSAKKIVATPSSALSSTSTGGLKSAVLSTSKVELQSVVSPQIVSKYDYGYGYLLKEKHIPATLELSDDAEKQPIPIHSVVFADKGKAVEFNIKPTVKQTKSIIQSYKVIGKVRGITSDVNKIIKLDPETTKTKVIINSPKGTQVKPKVIKVDSETTKIMFGSPKDTQVKPKVKSTGTYVPKYLFAATNPLVGMLMMLKPQEEEIPTTVVRTIKSEIKSAPTPTAPPSFDNAIRTAHVNAIPQSSALVPAIPLNNMVNKVHVKNSVSTSQLTPKVSQITPQITFTNTHNIVLKPSVITNRFNPQSSIQSEVSINSLSLKKNTIQQTIPQTIRQTALQKKNNVVNIPSTITIPRTIRKTLTVQGTTQKNINVQRPAQIVSNVLTNITYTIPQQIQTTKQKVIQKTIPAQILMPKWAKPLTTNIKYNPFKPTFVSFPMLPFAKSFGLHFPRHSKSKVVKTTPKPQKTIRKFSPFADALSINKMDFKLNKNNKNAVSYKFAIQPKQWQMKQWKPYFKATSPVLPTYRMLLNHNLKKSKSSVKHKKVRLW